MIGHVPCRVCKHGRAPLTKYAETVWGICNVFAQRKRFDVLGESEIAVCSLACYRLWQRDLYAADLEWQARERERAAEESERAALTRGTSRRGRL